MAQIKKILHEGEQYFSVNEVIELLKKSRSKEDAIKKLENQYGSNSAENYKVEEPLSNFNKKLKKGLNYNPKNNKDK